MGRWFTKEENIKLNQEKIMSTVNKVFLIGNLGQDVELKTLPNGSSVANFTVATSENWNDKTTGEKKTKTEWSKIVIWGKQAESCAKYLSKGKKACIEGKLETRTWENKDGVKMYTTEIKADQVTFLSSNTDAKPSTEFASNEVPF